MSSEIQVLTKKLQGLSEVFLTKTVIIPLFERLGYKRVQYYGGESEEGKDIVCWKEDQLHGPELIVAQVKHFKLSRKAADSKGLEYVVNQLINASAKSLPYVDKSMHLPSKVDLITTYEVDTKALAKRFASHPSLQDQRVNIIDGPQIASLLLDHAPHIVTQLLGPKFEIAKDIRPTLTNDALLSAISFSGTKDLKTIYTDIDFSLGRPTTQLFSSQSWNPGGRKLRSTKRIGKRWSVPCPERQKRLTSLLCMQSA